MTVVLSSSEGLSVAACFLPTRQGGDTKTGATIFGRPAQRTLRRNGPAGARIRPSSEQTGWPDLLIRNERLIVSSQVLAAHPMMSSARQSFLCCHTWLG